MFGSGSGLKFSNCLKICDFSFVKFSYLGLKFFSQHIFKSVNMQVLRTKFTFKNMKVPDPDQGPENGSDPFGYGFTTLLVTQILLPSTYEEQEVVRRRILLTGQTVLNLTLGLIQKFHQA